MLVSRSAAMGASAPLVCAHSTIVYAASRDGAARQSLRRRRAHRAGQPAAAPDRRDHQQRRTLQQEHPSGVGEQRCVHDAAAVDHGVRRDHQAGEQRRPERGQVLATGDRPPTTTNAMSPADTVNTPTNSVIGRSRPSRRHRDQRHHPRRRAPRQRIHLAEFAQLVAGQQQQVVHDVQERRRDDERPRAGGRQTRRKRPSPPRPRRRPRR